MRGELKKRSGSRLRFIGIFDRYGLKSAYKGLPKITILLNKLKTINEEDLCDHIWLNYTKRFQELGSLYPGDVVAFDARVGPYLKGYGEEKEVDYRLTRPSRVALVRRGQEKVPEGYYLICMGCGHRNESGRFSEEYARCRRCGHVLRGAPSPERYLEEVLPQFKQMSLAQRGG